MKIEYELIFIWDLQITEENIFDALQLSDCS